MFAQRSLIVSLTLALFTASASAGPLLYAVTFNEQFGPATAGTFGTIDPTTGLYTQIGPSMADPLGGLVQGGPTGYLGVWFGGNLDAVNPVTGAVSVIGSTGLGGLALDTAEVNGTVYETDLNQNLYRINTTTGLASLIGATGIEPAPTDPADLFDEAFFSANGKLYATWDSFNATTLALVDDPELYQINTTTGMATEVGATIRQIDAAIQVGGTIYAFTATNQVLSLNLSNGSTSFVADYGPTTSFVTGVAATPEPVSFILAGIGIAAVLTLRRQRHHC